jgi:hypothetical protein
LSYFLLVSLRAGLAVSKIAALPLVVQKMPLYGLHPVWMTPAYRPRIGAEIIDLEAEGWTVWWDKSLGAADLYRDEIMKQLASARAVIAIWTTSSQRSTMM